MSALSPHDKDFGFGRREQPELSTDRYLTEAKLLSRLRKGDWFLALKVGGGIALLLTVGIVALIAIAGRLASMNAKVEEAPAPVGPSVYRNFIDVVDPVIPKTRSGRLETVKGEIEDSVGAIVVQRTPQDIQHAYRAYLTTRVKMNPGDADAAAEAKIERRVLALRSSGWLDTAGVVREILKESPDDSPLPQLYSEAFYLKSPSVPVYARSSKAAANGERWDVYLAPLPRKDSKTPRTPAERNTLRASLRGLWIGAQPGAWPVGRESEAASAAVEYLRARRDDRALLQDPDPRVAEVKFARAWRTGDDLVLIKMLRDLFDAGKLHFYPEREAPLLLQFE